MGKEWKSWSRSLARKDEEESTAAAGCMSGMFHYFDFHHLLFTGSSNATTPNVSQRCSMERQHKVHATNQQLKGLEAPRNSLELDDGRSLSTSQFEEEYYDVPIAIQVAKSALSESKDSMAMMALEQEKRISSQAETPRTPSVVARLMGLDILPSQSSPSYSSSPQANKSYSLEKKANKKIDKHATESPPSHRQPLQALNCNIPNIPRVRTNRESYSLPETPRVSSERSRDSVPRLSLQISNNKENHYTSGIKLMEDLSCSMPTSPPSYAASRSWRKDHGRYQDENKSARSQYFAREVVKQVKETVSNRRGINNGCNNNTIGDENSSKVVKRINREVVDRKTSRSSIMNTQPSCSPPRIRILEASRINNNAGESKPQAISRSPPSPLPSSKLRESVSKCTLVEAKEVKKIVASKCKKGYYEKMTDRMKRQESPAEKFRKLENLSLPSLAQVFESQASTSQKQPVLFDRKIRSSNAPIMARCKESLSHLAQDQATLLKSGDHELHISLHSENNGMVNVSREKDPEYRYIKLIFQHAGYTAAEIPLFKHYSNSFPFDPIIFHQIELSLSYSHESQRNLGPLQFRWNRKLVYHLVQEILSDDLLHSTSTSQTSQPMPTEPVLLQRLLSRIKSYPQMNCLVVGDIDALVASDLSGANVAQFASHPLVMAQAKELVGMIEREIMDTLIVETASLLCNLLC